MAQLAFPFEMRPALAREDFVVSPANAEAVALLDRWPEWPVASVGFYGPAGSGKSHLVAVWAARSGARIFRAVGLDAAEAASLDAGTPVAVEDIDAAPATEKRDRALLVLFERTGAALLLTGVEPPATWAAALPDIASRFAALTAFPVWAPDDALLAALARKLFADRQLAVPDSVVARIVGCIERTPSAVRDFVALADREALARHSPVTINLVRALIAAREAGPS